MIFIDPSDIRGLHIDRDGLICYPIYQKFNRRRKRSLDGQG